MTDSYRVRVVDAGKRYTKYEDAPMLLSALRFRARTKRGQLWAVRHLDFEVAPGETIGIIGRNGSGKSTTLAMLAGVTAPTEGRVSVRGRVAPLISVGVGFHAELTGRENIYVNGTILGMSRKMLDARLDAIVDFSEVEEFIDTPVKFYSSGMVVRLGFAVAVQAEPEVLLVDEVLAVGDIAFQVKCFQRMNEIKELGTTVVVVSHNLSSVRLLCDRTLVIHRGELRFDGDTDDAISLFHQLLGSRDLGAGEIEGTHNGARFTSVRLLDSDGSPTGHVAAGDTLTLELEIVFEREAATPVIGVAIDTETGVRAAQTTTAHLIEACRPGSRVRLQAELVMRFATGTYGVSAFVYNFADTADLTRETTAMCVSVPTHCYVAGRYGDHGIVDVEPRFKAEVQHPD